MTPRTLFLAFIVSLPAILAGAAIDTGADFNRQVRELTQGETPVYWPTRGIPRFQSETVEVPFDGARVQRTFFRGPISLQMNPLTGWTSVPTRNTRYSLLAYGQGISTVQFGFAYMSREAFLPEKSREALRRYALGLLVRQPPKTRVTILTDFEQPLPRKPFAFLGQVPLVLDYRIENEESGEVRARREYFVLIDDAWLVFVVENEPQRIQQTINAVENVLAFAAVVG